MTEREILAELERLIGDLGSMKSEPLHVDKLKNMEHSLGEIRDFLKESRARQEVSRYREQAPAEEMDDGAGED